MTLSKNEDLRCSLPKGHNDTCNYLPGVYNPYVEVLILGVRNERTRNVIGYGEEQGRV